MGFMATLSTSSVLSVASTNGESTSFTDNPELGPLLDDGAPFSSIGEIELRTISSTLIYPQPPIEENPVELKGYDMWQYGSGAHKSPEKIILGSVEIFVRTKKKSVVSIRDLVIQGSSTWVVGRNVTRKCTIEHIIANELCLPSSPTNDTIPMVDDNFHSYIAKDRFLEQKVPSPSANTL